MRTSRQAVRASAARGDGNGDYPVVEWQVGDWRLSPEILSLFEALGRQE